MTDRQDDLTDWQRRVKKVLNKNIAPPPRPLGGKSDARKAAVYAAVIERCVDAAWPILTTLSAEMPSGSRYGVTGDTGRVVVALALSALRPGDVLPNGCVVVPDNDWAVVAQFSALSPAKKRAVFAFIDAAKEEG